MIYPEATITRDPGLWPMTGKTGAARVALVTGAPVIPIAQWGAQDVLAPYGKRLRLLPRKTMHLRPGRRWTCRSSPTSPMDSRDCCGR